MASKQPEEGGKHLKRGFKPQFRYWLYDLSQVPEQQIKGQVALRLSLLVLKYLQQPQADAAFVGLIDLMLDLAQQQRGIEQLVQRGVNSYPIEYQRKTLKQSADERSFFV